MSYTFLSNRKFPISLFCLPPGIDRIVLPFSMVVSEQVSGFHPVVRIPEDAVERALGPGIKVNDVFALQKAT